jgi:hypothetical protein
MDDGRDKFRNSWASPVWRSVAVIVTFLIGFGMVIVPGCTKPLFPDTAARTQFDSYDIQRGQFVEQRQYDPYGKPIPAIRERLRIR